MMSLRLLRLVLANTPRSRLDLTGTRTSRAIPVDGFIHRQALFQRGIGTTLVASTPIHREDHRCQIPPPPFHYWELARDVFSNPCFYHSQEEADSVKEKREAVLKDMAVGEVYQTYILGHKNGVRTGAIDFADMIAARGSIVNRFFHPPKITVEEALVREKLINLSGTLEIDAFQELSIAHVPTVENMWRTTSAQVNSQGEKTRALPLCLVLGPNGSGKTCFALQYLTKGFLNTTGKGHVTVYVRPAYENVDFQVTNPSAPQDLIHAVREGCARHIGQEILEKIDMHVCIIFDGAGSLHTNTWFENKQVLESLCQEASKLASSVAIVLVGAGITGYNLNPVEDAYIFRMKPWQPKDLSQILHIPLRWNESNDTVVNAIFAHPKLGALATNAQMAYLLYLALFRRLKSSDRSSGWSWDRLLDDWSATLVTQVVDDYISGNCLRSLAMNERRRVAAVVFRTLQELKPGDATLPTFPALNIRQLPAVHALVQYNLECRDGKTQVVPDEEFAFTVTPAIAIILFHLAGVPNTVAFVPRSRVAVEVAALYAFRQTILNCTERFASNLRNGSFPKQLDDSLAKVCLLKLDKGLGRKKNKVLVPMLPAETIMISGDGHSFVDVIAPYTLIKCLSNSSPSPPQRVNLLLELDKCGLLKQSRETRLLQGLLALWQGSFDMVKDMRQDQTRMSSQSSTMVRYHPQLSKAFPESYFLSRVPPIETMEYAMIKGKSGLAISMGKRKKPISLPFLDRTIHPVTWILSTNSEALRVQLGRSTMTITEANLDENMEINVDTLHDEKDKSAWTSLMTEKIREGVKIKILFTM